MTISKRRTRMSLVEELLKDFTTEEVERIVDNLKIPIEIRKIPVKPANNRKKEKLYQFVI
jgi:hypothetical protein